MPANNFKIGPMSSLYVGMYGETDILTRVTAVTTGPTTVTESLPETFVPGLQTTIQSGLHEVSFNMTFYGDDELILRLSRGLDLVSGNADDPPEFNTYQVLLLHPIEDEPSSFFFPRMRIVHTTALNYDKTRATEIGLQFIWQDRNRYTRIYYQDTYDNLAAIMGAVSPI